MKVVFANGDLVNLGSNTKVHSSGYQIERLIVLAQVLIYCTDVY